jgi:hypothetical protein
MAHRKGIPPVRWWRVRYWHADGFILRTVFVRTITKRLARMIAASGNLDVWARCERITVSLDKSR